MNPAIAELEPRASTTKERTVMVVWPSNAVYPLARLLGRLYECHFGAYIFTLGNLVALLSAPVALLLFLRKIGPFSGMRYRLTDRRIVVERGLTPVYERGVDLDRFSEIDVEIRPGQAWYDAGDLVFRLGTTETFRLPGVSRPQAFRQTCLKSQRSFTGVAKYSPARQY